MLKPPKVSLLYCCVLALSACSNGGPSDSEVQAAMKARFDSEPKLISAKKIKCTAISAPTSYNCSVELVVELPIGRHKGVTAAIMERKGNGWTTNNALDF